MLTRDFIEHSLIEGIYQMTVSDDGHASHPFLGFSVVASAIEVLGACLDEHEWKKTGLSEARFRLAVRELFPVSYQLYNTETSRYDLYAGLRCSLAHVLQPGSLISLSERKHEESAGVIGAHLKMQQGKLLLIYEDFLADFVVGGKEVIRRIDNREISHQKVYTHVLSIPSDKVV
jgi:hypothetical protein